MTKQRLNQEDLEYFRKNNLGQSLMEVARHFQKYAMEVFIQEGYKLQASHQAVLVHLGLSGARLTDLAKRASMTKQAMGQLVDEVEALGYVERVSDPTDKRAKLVRFTQNGCEMMKSGTKVGMSIQAEYTSIIGKKKMEQLRALLDELHEKIRRKGIDGSSRQEI